MSFCPLHKKQQTHFSIRCTHRVCAYKFLCVCASNQQAPHVAPRVRAGGPPARARAQRAAPAARARRARVRRVARGRGGRGGGGRARGLRHSLCTKSPAVALGNRMFVVVEAVVSYALELSE